MPSLSAYYAFAFDPQGNLVWRDNSPNTATLANDITVYDAYGNLLLDQTTDNTQPTHYDSVGFAGQYGTYTDAEIGRGSSGIASPVLMTHRYYDPRTGRFINRDPIGYNGGINLYGYAGGNPVNEIDPEGTDSTLGYFNFPDVFTKAAGDYIWSRIKNTPAGRIIHYTFDSAVNPHEDPPLSSLEITRQQRDEAAAAGIVTTWRNGWRSPDGKFRSPLGSERAGEEAVESAKQLFTRKGWTVENAEVSFRNPNTGQLRRYDVLVRSPKGSLIGVEVKSGSAVRTVSQRVFDLAVNASRGSSAVGVGEARGITIRRAIIIVIEDAPK